LFCLSHFPWPLQYLSDFIYFLRLLDTRDEDYLRKLEEILEGDANVVQHSAGQWLHGDEADIVLST
jgi:hypothetical protein